MIAYKVTVGNSSFFITGKYDIAYSHIEGMVITSLPNTYGIFCFEKKSQANEFLKRSFSVKKGENYILKIRGIGEPFYPRKISYHLENESFDDFYNYNREVKTTKPIEGTVCFPAIEIIKVYKIEVKN